MITKPKGGKGGSSTSSGGSSSKVTYIQGVATEAEHATRADKAKQAENAEQAGYASTAGTAERANYAAKAEAAETAEYADKAGSLSDDSDVWKKVLRKDLISADHWEEVMGMVRFLNDVEFAKGVTFKDAVKFLATITSTNINNSGTIKTKNLEVTGLAHFFELVIDKIKSAGGAALFTPADGFDVDIVEEIEGGYRLYWRCQDGNGNQRDNMWKTGDQALCMSFNKAKVGTSHDVANKYYWSLVTGVSEAATPIEKDGEYYNYIEISSSDCDGTVNPEKGDSIVMLGYRGEDDKARQSAIYLSAYTSLDKGLNAPAFAQYRGINDFDLASHRKSYWDATGSKVVGKFEMESGESLDDYIKDNTAVTEVYQIEVDGMFRVDKDGNFTGTNYYQDKKDTRAVGVTLYRMKGDVKEVVGDGSYYMVVEPSSGVYLSQSPQGHSSNLVYLKQSELAKAPSYITVKVYNLTTDETTHAPIPGRTLYASTTIPILRDGTAGKDGIDGINGVPGASGKGIVAAYKYSDDTPAKPAATKNETNLGGGWYNVVPTVAPQWNGWSLDKDTAPDGDRWWYKSPTTGHSERTSFKCVFNTTSDNQEVNFYLYSSSEKGWDYVYVSEVDATEVPSKPGVNSTGKVSNGTSGVYTTDSNGSVTYNPFLQITKTIAKKGTHTIFVCYAKDGSGSSGSDCGWFAMDGSISFTASTPDVLWQSNGVLDGDTITSWTDPFRVTGKDGKRGEDGNDGKGALEILISPETLVFDTEDNGIVLSSTSKTASIACYRDGAQETNVSYGFQDATNCKGNVSDNGKGIGTVTISSIDTQAIDSGTSVSVTSGYVVVLVWDKVTDIYHYIHVPFTVNVSKYTGKMLADNKKFQTQYTEISNKYNNLPLKTDAALKAYTSSIEQTAREISLKVSEKAVGRRNMLPGSALRKQDDGPEICLYSHTIQGIMMNGGIDGTNYLRCESYFDGSTQQYAGLFWRGGVSKNIKIQPNKKYFMSCWVKCDRTDVTIALEVIYKPSEIADTSERKERPSTKLNKRAVSKANTWELFTCEVDTTNAAYNYIEANFLVAHSISGVTATACFCRPMLEESDEYNGWTLSEEDYDYIGGNLLDNASTLNVSGNLCVSEGELKENAFEDGVNARYAKVSSGYKALAQWGLTNNPVGLQPNTDYIFSFWAKGTSLIAYAYRGNNDAEMVTEDCNGNFRSSTQNDDGNSFFTLTSQWKRYWVHWRTKSRSEKIPQMILLRTTTEAWIAKPKLEIGCTMTDWTEKRTDMVDKQALLATGIDIANQQITITANKTQFRDNNNNTMAMFEDGKLKASLVDAKNVVTNGLQANKIDAKNATITNLICQDVKIYGSTRNPFTLASKVEDTNMADNVVTRSESESSWVDNYALPWDESQSGRLIRLANGYWDSLGNASGYATADAPSGKFFYYDGKAKSRLYTQAGEIVELLGYGSPSQFYGWVVVNRSFTLKSLMGQQIPILMMGNVIVTISSNGSVTIEGERKCYNGGATKVTRTSVGVYQVYFPSDISTALRNITSNNSYLFQNVVLIQLTGILGTYDISKTGVRNAANPAKATLYNVTYEYFEVHVSDDETVNDGSFNYTVMLLQDMRVNS